MSTNFLLTFSKTTSSAVFVVFSSTFSRVTNLENHLLLLSKIHLWRSILWVHYIKTLAHTARVYICVKPPLSNVVVNLHHAQPPSPVVKRIALLSLLGPWVSTEGHILLYGSRQYILLCFAIILRCNFLFHKWCSSLRNIHVRFEHLRDGLTVSKSGTQIAASDTQTGVGKFKRNYTVS